MLLKLYIHFLQIKYFNLNLKLILDQIEHYCVQSQIN